MTGIRIFALIFSPVILLRLDWMNWRSPLSGPFWFIDVLSVVVRLACVLWQAFVAHDLMAASVWAGLAAIAAYILWRKRPPRKRKPSKVLGTIRNLGHRLVISPAPLPQ